MIKNYSDHAANERTFLAWLRTGLAIVAFGFLIQRFNLFLVEFAAVEGTRAPAASRLAGVFAPLGRYDGFIVTIMGVAIILLGGVRFLRTTREIDTPELHGAEGVRAELLVSLLLAFFAAAFCGYLAFQ